MRNDDLELEEDEIEEGETDEELELEDDAEELEGYGGMAVLRGFAAGLVVGALVGAGIAILVAPERGEVLRKRIGTGLRDIQEDARGQLEDWHDDARRELSKQRRKIKRRLRKARRR